MLTRARPFAQVEAFRRERTHRRLVHCRKRRRSGALALTERSPIDAVAKLPDRLVQLFNREELPVPQRRNDPTLDQLHTRLDFGLGEKRALQTVTRVDYKFSLSRIRSIH